MVRVHQQRRVCVLRAYRWQVAVGDPEDAKAYDGEQAETGSGSGSSGGQPHEGRARYDDPKHGHGLLEGVEEEELGRDHFSSFIILIFKIHVIQT